MMCPVLTETEYRNLRNSVRQKTVMKAIRGGDEGQKTKLWEVRPNSKWIHVSYKSTGENRQQVFSCKG